MNDTVTSSTYVLYIPDPFIVPAKRLRIANTVTYNNTHMATERNNSTMMIRMFSII